jgi:transcriptional regulator with XRE-family HTH domain
MTTAATTQDVTAVSSFRQLLAAEVRAELARQQVTGRRLARLVGESPAWAARRLAGATAIDADDLERIAHAIGVPISSLLMEAARRADSESARPVTGADTRR